MKTSTQVKIEKKKKRKKKKGIAKEEEKRGKLQLTILNYTANYNLHLKLSICMFSTLNYDHYYALYLTLNFAPKLCHPKLYF